MIKYGLETFDAIYCINLKESVDRKKSFSDQMKEIGLLNKIVFFEAIKDSQNGHMGCLQSHRSIIKIALKNKHKNVLIFEDDAELIKENLQYLKGVIKELHGEKWYLFYLGCSFIQLDIPSFQKKKHIYQIFGGRGTHAIAYNELFYEKFLQITDGNEGKNILNTFLGFDVYLSLIGQELFKSYMPLKPIFKQRAGFSNIANKIINRDNTIIDNFERMTRQGYVTTILLRILKKTFAYLWLLSKGKINIFQIIDKYNNKYGRTIGSLLRKSKFL